MVDLLSPGVFTREVDLSGSIRSAPSSSGAFIGAFNWGPVDTIRDIADKTQLASVFGQPDITNTRDFHTAVSFLNYSRSMKVVRADSELSTRARVLDGTPTDYTMSANYTMGDIVFFVGTYYTANTNIPSAPEEFDVTSWTEVESPFTAKHKGSLGNSLKIDICPAGSAFTTWDHKNLFNSAPDTGEVHLVLIDLLGEFTGKRNGVLQTFEYLDIEKVPTLIERGSEFITAEVDKTFAGFTGMATSYTLTGGKNGTIDHHNIIKSLGLTFALPSESIDFLIANGLDGDTEQVTLVNEMVALAQARKDFVVVASPNANAIIGNSSPVEEIITTAIGYTTSSYLFVDSNYLSVFDVFNEAYVWIPASGSTAGIMSASDASDGAWYSPAGGRRGIYRGVTRLAWNPSQTDSDVLYQASVNPITNRPGQGIVLFGDKTHLTNAVALSSAFDRINVRRLFIVIERAIARAAEDVLFEFNDEFTRMNFENTVTPFLRGIQGRRGINRFFIDVGDSVNTDQVINSNEFRANIFIDPARSINFVTLTFVATRSGVSFEEVVGIV